MLLGLLKICDTQINNNLVNYKVTTQKMPGLSKQKQQYHKHFQVTQTLPQMSHNLFVEECNWAQKTLRNKITSKSELANPINISKIAKNHSKPPDQV